MPVGLTTGRLGLDADTLKQGVADGLLLYRSEQERLVLALDSPFDRWDAEVGRLAASGLGDAAQAAEVLVDAAVAAVAPVAETTLADPAVNRAAEVVFVLLRAITAGFVGGQDTLYPLEGLLIDQGLMAALDLDAPASDQAGVVVVFEHPMNHAARQGAARPLQRASGYANPCPPTGR